MLEDSKVVKQNILLGAVFIIFATIYSLISLVNHYNFRTAALDLGMFNHAIYQFSHFSGVQFTLGVEGVEGNYLSGHFSLLTFLIAPLSYLFGSYTLLIVQIAAILFGGYGVYKYARLRFSDGYIPLIILIHFFGIFGIVSALAFDFHENVLAAMFVPWLVYFYQLKQKKWFVVFFVLILISKENMALWLVFILLGLMLKNWKLNYRNFIRFEIPLMAVAFFYFLFVMKIAMPWFTHSTENVQMARYSHLGNSFSEIAWHLLTHPKLVFSMLFENTLENKSLDGIKAELHFMVMISGGFLFFLRPYYFVMLIPIYAQKFFVNEWGFWGISSHYAIEFVPIISLCVIDSVSKIKSVKVIYPFLIGLTVLTYKFTHKKIERRETPWYDKTNSAFYRAQHYESGLNVKAIRKALEMIPDDAVVSSSTNLSPHLAFRDKIFHYPVIKNADYIALFTAKRSFYPFFNEESFKASLQHLIDAKEFEVIYDANDLMILRRKISKYNSLHIEQ